MFFTDDMSMSISGSSSDEMDDMDFDMDVPFDYLDIEEDVDMMTFHMVINDGVFTEDEEKLFVEGMKYENRIMIMRRKKEMKKEKIKRKLISAREKTKEERREDLVQRNIDKKKDNCHRRNSRYGRYVYRPPVYRQDEDVPQTVHEREVLGSIKNVTEETGISQQALLELLNRELTPEDYELLLLLDKSVAPKTVDDDKIKSFNTNVVNKIEDLKEKECCICMEAYVVGDSIKELPCGHVFHENCITTWLTNSSQNCPLDGLSVN